ncbi:hypothetical protein BGW36DRAFT_292789 [Talaromyces proteolyticus]|uniref:HECT-type E3 ubiquitin transferase n=1 Tax=Talaromyces proteolyticus TaxID=1131652 RepID=A0AAD4PXX8_9EURO|nr:uncharacterized protein BGW36DRAFT_292789 [Talaromyces proteolyticus]KAH8700535.1 hypothetical protein BGW36DRAFT_292789 [Talaromyces proteolyticus]
MPTWSSRILSPSSPTSNPSHARASHRTIDTDRSAAFAIDYNVPVLSTPPGPNRSHRRSLSQPFPSLIPMNARKGERKVTKDDFLDSDDDDDDGDAISYVPEPKSHSPRKGWTPAEDVVSGKCMTCSSAVRWPKDRKVFRCTICLTVNDLEPCLTTNDHKIDDGRPPTPPPKDGSFEPKLPATPLSVEKTKEIIDNCLLEFLQRRLAGDQGQQFSLVEPSFRQINHPQQGNPGPLKQGKTASHNHDERKHNAGLLGPLNTMTHGNERVVRLRSSSDTPPIRRNGRSPQGQDRSPRGGTNTRNLEQRSRSETRPLIFRQLEDYIIKSFTGCDCLNNSFLTPGPTRRTVSEGIYTRSHADMSILTASHDAPEFELDPKMLLLGDIAENSSWWVGGRPRRHEIQDATVPGRPGPRTSRSRVNSKSPRIDWDGVVEWYQLILNAGESWRDFWSTLTKNELILKELKPELAKMIDREIAEARVHAQRTLLKATENLLKRPRRPLPRPESARFLLILLENPFLASKSTPTTRNLSPSGANNDLVSIRNFSRPRETGDRRETSGSAPSKPRGLSDHSGIVKRILGLVSNLPDDCHRYFVGWFARYSHGQYERFVSLVGRFLTYRLTRQRGRQRSGYVQPTNGLVPNLPGDIETSHAQLHAVLSGLSSDQGSEGNKKLKVYTEDWQIRAAARVMALLFAANNANVSRRRDASNQNTPVTYFSQDREKSVLPLNFFYNTLLDYSDLVSDFESWESRTAKFSFCQYPFLLSISAKSRILEHDARRQMTIKAREAFLDSILRHKDVSQYLNLKVRRDCLVEDSLRGVSEVVGAGQEEIKKSLRIEFVGEEGVDAGGLRKEWFLLLVREVFDPNHGLFVYDEDSQFCYFNPFCFESSEQFFLVGVLLGLAIYNSTILDIALPPFAFKKLLAAASPANMPATTPKQPHTCTLDDLAEYRPTLAKGLRALLEYDGNVQETFCYDFVARVDRYGQHVEVPLCSGGEKRPVTNSNRQQFVNLYVHYLLDTSVQKQFEPFKRGFYTVCGGNAFSLFRPEEIELMVRGSDEPLDVPTLRAVATYENWPTKDAAAESDPVVTWFWEFFARSKPSDQRKLLSFVTGSDRIPATGAASLSIRLACLGEDCPRYPIAHTCFNKLGLFRYATRKKFEQKLWGAIFNSEGFGLR